MCQKIAAGLMRYTSFSGVLQHLPETIISSAHANEASTSYHNRYDFNASISLEVWYQNTTSK